MVAPAPAQAQWTVCNESSYVAQTAIAFTDGDKRVTEGWMRVRPGECAVVRDAPLTPGDHYLYARGSDAHAGGSREWLGATPLCIDENDFSISGDATCEEVGFQTRRFVRVSVTEAEKRSTLREARPYVITPERASAEERLAGAAIAGKQRLLRDAGYGIGTVDGLAGRQTVREIDRFLREEGIEGELSEAALIDRLEATARRREDQRGLRLCNRTNTKLWTAIALRMSDGWESRGWWPLEPEDCAKVIDEALEQPAYYVYAATRGDGRDAPLAEGSETFCLAETRFAILGRENCQGRGYGEGRFATVIRDDRDAITMELTADSFTPSARALRQ